jgi:hypothetical protein
MPPSSTPATAPNAPTAAPGAERRVAFAALVERGGEDRQRGGGDDRRAEALEPARDDQRAVVPCEAGEQRRDAEDDQPGAEHPPAAEQVGRAAAEQQEAAEQQRVGADHPLEVLLGEPEVTLD